ncbi:MAG: DUF2795 domain-containing protein [Chlorobiaceae bacterium]|nr:DUF2795 domain-containing protein [Chlorobiaceae bacterium]
MYWNLDLARYIADAPWPVTKDELINYANRTGAPQQVIDNLNDLPESDELYESIEEIWPDYPTDEDFIYGDEELLT